MSSKCWRKTDNGDYFTVGPPCELAKATDFIGAEQTSFLFKLVLYAWHVKDVLPGVHSLHSSINLKPLSFLRCTCPFSSFLNGLCAGCATFEFTLKQGERLPDVPFEDSGHFMKLFTHDTDGNFPFPLVQNTHLWLSAVISLVCLPLY